MPTTINATETPILDQWMEQAMPTHLSQWAVWANAELQQHRLVNAQLHDELARMMTGGIEDAMIDELNAGLRQAEHWVADVESRDAMVPELLASPMYGASVHK